MFCFPFSVIFGNTFLVNVKFRIRFFMGNRKLQFAVTRLKFRVAEISNFSKVFRSVQSIFI